MRKAYNNDHWQRGLARPENAQRIGGKVRHWTMVDGQLVEVTPIKVDPTVAAASRSEDGAVKEKIETSPMLRTTRQLIRAKHKRASKKISVYKRHPWRKMPSNRTPEEQAVCDRRAARIARRAAKRAARGSNAESAVQTSPDLAQISTPHEERA